MKQQTFPPTLIQPTRSPPRPGTTPLSVVAMLLLAVMWGLSIPATKFGLLTVPPLILTTMRFAVAVPLLFLFTAGRPGLPARALPARRLSAC